MGAMSVKWRDNKDKRGSADEVLCEISGNAEDVFVESRLDSCISRLRIQSQGRSVSLFSCGASGLTFT
jgi:hypothetical protein